MQFPEAFYFRFLKAGPQPPRTLFNIGSASSSSISVLVNYVVPDDYDALITNILAQYSAGPAQAVVRGSFFFWLRNSTSNYYIAVEEAPAGATIFNMDRQFSGLYLPAGSTIYALGTFDAGAVANAAVFNIQGMLIPQAAFLV